MAGLTLERFIYQVKKELLEAQEKHQHELGFFSLQNVELEIRVAGTYEGDGKVNLSVVEKGSDISKNHTHSVRLTFGIVPEFEQPPIESPSDQFELESDATDADSPWWGT